MPEAGYLLEVIVILSAAVVSVLVLQRLKLGSVLGYLVAGTVIGPSRRINPERQSPTSLKIRLEKPPSTRPIQRASLKSNGRHE